MSNVQTGEGRVGSTGGLDLSYRSWLPDTDPTALLLIVHGLGDHSGRYDHVARHFAGRGFGCWALDYRGHGRSPGGRVHVSRFAEFVEDVDAMRSHLQTTRSGLPLFLLGHSQGGLIVLLSTLGAPGGLAGVVVSSPFLGIHPTSRPSPLLAGAARVLSRLAPALRLDNGVDAALISRDPAVVRAYERDPLVSHKVSARWFTELLGAQHEALAGAGRLAVPALVMQSGEDRLVDPDATRRWAAAAPPALVEFVQWPGLYHEMLNEPEQDTVLARIDGWLDSKLVADHRPG
jgi:alpha-beta hydrolase superfamily lysophospholipase